MKEFIFYKIEEVAELLQVSKMTIYRYVKARKIKGYKIGKEIRIDKTDFEKFLKKVEI